VPGVAFLRFSTRFRRERVRDHRVLCGCLVRTILHLGRYWSDYEGTADFPGNECRESRVCPGKCSCVCRCALRVGILIEGIKEVVERFPGLAEMMENLEVGAHV
jgi:hypothetical protein